MSAILGESPPPPPRACFGRDELVEKIVGLAEDLTPIALIGAGGIGKTSIALTVLHHDRTKKRFGDNRRFLRCDQFSASRTNFLNRLSKVIGAGVENPEDLSPLRPFLSSREMIIFLDNAESILDPEGPNSHEIYAVAEELVQFRNICLCFTSRISTIPTSCENLNIPTLSMEPACATFYNIYKNGEQSDLVNEVLEQLDFHPLSIALLATVAYHNGWDINRLTREWGSRRTEVLRTRHKNSLAAAIELSLASPMFQELGPDARGLLGVIAFFPQGIDENNLDWLFPTISDRANIFDSFCVLSLTYRSNGFVTMLAPLRDHLCPKDPGSFPLLRTTKDHYFSRLSVVVDPALPNQEARWIASEDVNVEHLLDIFTSIDADSVAVWDACAFFMGHIRWHKPRLVVLGPKVEGLPDGHPSKPECLHRLSQLFHLVGNHGESKRLLGDTLKLRRKQGEDRLVAYTLTSVSIANGALGLREEAAQQAKEALEIYERLNDAIGQAKCLNALALLFSAGNNLDAAEEAASRAIDLLPDESERPTMCECYVTLGEISRSKGKTEEAIKHLETALGIATTFNWKHILFSTHLSLARLYSAERRFDIANSHVERAKPCIDDPYLLGYVSEVQATIWFNQRRLDEAKPEVLHAINLYEEVGSERDMERAIGILLHIEDAMSKRATSHQH